MKTRVQIQCKFEDFKARVANLETMGFVLDKTVKPRWYINTIRVTHFDRADIVIEHEESKYQELIAFPDIKLIDI